MKQVLFLVNSLKEFDFQDLIEELLPEAKTTVCEILPERLDEYSLVILWSYRKLIPEVVGHNNVIVFHSSDLPEGKGWAPVYHALSQGKAVFTISGIRPAADADTGDIVAQARFTIRPEFTAVHLRKWDRRISIMMAARILERYPVGGLVGRRQTGEGSKYPRRKPEQNQVDLSRPLGDLVNHLRACEAAHPAFFLFQGVRYDISITPHAEPVFPADLEIRFHDSP